MLRNLSTLRRKLSGKSISGGRAPGRRSIEVSAEALESRILYAVAKASGGSGTSANLSNNATIRKQQLLADPSTAPLSGALSVSYDPNLVTLDAVELADGYTIDFNSSQVGVTGSAGTSTESLAFFLSHLGSNPPETGDVDIDFTQGGSGTPGQMSPDQGFTEVQEAGPIGVDTFSVTFQALSGVSLSAPRYTVFADPNGIAGTSDFLIDANGQTIPAAAIASSSVGGPATVSVTDPGGTFTGSAFPATAEVNGFPSLEGVSPTIAYYSGTSANGTPLSGAPSAVGIYTAAATFAGSTDYTAAVGSTTFVISPSTPPTWLSSLSAATFNSATSTLTVTGPTLITADPGSAEPNIVASGSNAQVTIAPTVSDQDIHIGGVTLTGGAGITMQSVGTTRSHGNHNVLVVGTLGAANDPTFSIDSSSKVNLQDNDLIIHTGTSDTAGQAELANVQALAAIGRAVAPGGNLSSNTIDAWSGNGLASSTAAAADALTGPNAGYELNVLGVVDNSDLVLGSYRKWIVGSAVETLARNDILVKYTYNGDFTLEGNVSTDAATLFSGLYAPSIRQNDFAFGDVNGDGFVDAADATAFDGLLYGLGTPAAAANGEPTTLL